MTHLGDRRAFHLDSRHGGEEAAGSGNAFGITHKLIAGADQSFFALNTIMQFRYCRAGYGDKCWGSGKTGWHAGNLPWLVTKRGDIHIVVTDFGRDDHITNMQFGIKTTGRAGIDDAFGRETLQQQSRGHSGGYLADP